MVNKCHEEVKHKRVRGTINFLREEFWVSKARNFIKLIINKCTTCGRHNGTPFDYPKVGRLPEVRVTFGFPFAAIEIDHAGQIFDKNVYGENDKGLYKSRIVKITCYSSRCTYSFGAPKLIISEDAPSFLQEVKKFK